MTLRERFEKWWAEWQEEAIKSGCHPTPEKLKGGEPDFTEYNIKNLIFIGFVQGCKESFEAEQNVKYIQGRADQMIADAETVEEYRKKAEGHK